jgi:hypothetical protein
VLCKLGSAQSRGAAAIAEQHQGNHYPLLTDIIVATPETVFQDEPSFEFEIVPGDEVNLLRPEVIARCAAVTLL